LLYIYWVQKTYSNMKIKKLASSEIEIEGEISKEAMAHSRNAAIQRISKEAELPGFRKGHVPEHILVEKMGEMHILEEAAEIALGEAYPHIIVEHNIHVISRPSISITKIAKDNPLGFKIKVPVFPEVELPDYKRIAEKEAVKKENLEVKPDEVDRVIAELRENKAGIGNKEDKNKNPLPEVDDAFVKSFGNFKNVDDFTTKIKENLLEEKKTRAKDKIRLEIGQAIIKETKMELPETLVEGEMQKMEYQFEEDLKRMGVKMDDYMKHLGKEKDALKKEWRKPAEDRGKLQIILNMIAERENIKVSPEEIEKEVSHIQEHHKEINKEKAASYVEMMLTNEKVFQFLESGQK
jgi:FKBP-type peptidyl-prolyl cis-trans isomerase (trigger factor)